MKKTIRSTFVILLIVMLTVSLFACSAGNPGGQASSSSASSSAPASATTTVNASPSQSQLGLPASEVPSEAGKITQMPVTKDMKDGKYAGLISNFEAIDGQNTFIFDEVDNGDNGTKVNKSTMIICLPIAENASFKLKDAKEATASLDDLKAALSDSEAYYVITVAGGLVTQISYGGKITANQ